MPPKGDKIIGIKPMPWDSLQPYGFNACIGKRNTGKSSLLEYIACTSKRAKTATWIVIAGNEAVKKFWSKHVHHVFVLSPSLEYLEFLYKLQDSRVKKYEESGEPFPEYEEIELIIDDCAAKGWFMRSKILDEFSTVSRHLKINLWAVYQYAILATTTQRTNWDTLAVKATCSVKNIQTYQKEFVSCSPLREFTAILMQVTREKGTLFIDNNSESMKVESICYSSRLKKESLHKATHFFNEETNMEEPILLGHPMVRAWADKRCLVNIQQQIHENNEEYDAENNDGDEEEYREIVGLEVEDTYTTSYSDRFGRIIVREIKTKDTKND